MSIYDNLSKHVCLPTAVETKEGFANVSAVLVLVDPFSFFLFFFLSSVTVLCVCLCLGDCCASVVVPHYPTFLSATRGPGSAHCPGLFGGLRGHQLVCVHVVKVVGLAGVCVHLGEDEFSGYTGTQGVDADVGLLLLWLMSGRKRGETFHPSCAKRSDAFLPFFFSSKKKKTFML